MQEVNMFISFSESLLTENEEKVLLISIIGILETLKRGGLSINEAEKFLFSPHMIAKLKEKKCSNKIVDILERGCELEDISSLLPHRLESNIDKLIEQSCEVMKTYPIFDKIFWV